MRIPFFDRQARAQLGIRAVMLEPRGKPGKRYTGFRSGLLELFFVNHIAGVGA